MKWIFPVSTMPGRRVFLPWILAVLILRAAPAAAADGAGMEPKPALWAFYYAWYSTPQGPRQGWEFWRQRGAPADQARYLSAAVPLVGPYDSDDAEIIRWHIRLAKAAGIDAFLVSWWGNANLSGAALENVILPVAAEEGFHIAVCNERAQFHREAADLHRLTIDVLRRTKDSPAYLRIDGKPVMYLYQVPFAPKLTPQSFIDLRRAVEAEIGPVYWIMDKVANPMDRGLFFPEPWLEMSNVAMLGFYGTFSVKRIWKYDDLLPHYRRLANEAHAAGKRVLLPVHPGHDNSVQRPDDYFIIPRDDGATLRGYLQAATEAGADVVAITSFNEWPETTVVEPSSSWSDPYQYLRILADWKGVDFRPPSLPSK
jgi:hypothetical protein